MGGRMVVEGPVPPIGGQFTPSERRTQRDVKTTKRTHSLTSNKYVTTGEEVVLE